MSIGQVSEDMDVEMVEEVLEDAEVEEADINPAPVPSISIVTRGQTAQAFRANRDMHS